LRIVLLGFLQYIGERRCSLRVLGHRFLPEACTD
jgi:hypothetical protein